MTEEEALVRSFVVRTRRDRLIELLGNAKQRAKATARLAHFRDLDPRFIVALPPNEQRPEAIARALRSRGAGDSCYVVSENTMYDGKRALLREVLDVIVGNGMGTLISCIPGSLAYFEGEGPSDRCLLVRSAVDGITGRNR